MKTSKRYRFIVVLSLLVVASAQAVVITADDLWDSAVIAGTVSGSPVINTRYGIGYDLVVGDVTFSGFTNDGVTPSWLSYYATSDAAGIGVNEEYGSANARNNIYDNQGIDISFASGVTIAEVIIGRWGPSDGAFEISGFTADPVATAVNYNYSNVSQGAVATSYDSGMGTLTVQALSVFGYARVSFSNAVNLSRIGLRQAGNSNDGMCFHSISYTPTTVPSITVQPSDQLVNPGDSAVFSVQAAGSMPITYDWYKTDSETPNPLSDELVQSGTTESLTISASDLLDEAFYYCVVSNDSGSATCEPAALGVKRLQAHWQLDQVEYDAAGYYPDSSSEDSVAQNAIPAGVPTFVDGVKPTLTQQGVQMDVNGAATAGTWDPSKYSSQFTVTGWLYLNQADAPQPIVGKRDAWSDAGDRWFLQVDGNAALSLEAYGQSALVSGPVEVDKWTMVTAVFDGTVGQLYIDGVLAAENGFSLSNGQDATVRIGHWDGNAFDGVLDDIRIYNYALTSEAIIQLHYETSGRGVCDPSNTIQFDVAGPHGPHPDCKVDFYDLLVFISEWMQ